MGSNVTAAWRAHRKGAYMANPCYTQIHPTCIPVSGDAPEQAHPDVGVLRNDGRIWVPKKLRQGLRRRNPRDIPEEDRDYYLERRYPAFGNLVPRDVASRAAKERATRGFGVNKTGEAVVLDFESAGSTSTSPTCHRPPRKEKRAVKVVSEKYGNLFDMYEHHGREPLRARRCGSTPPCTTPWAACGSTTT
jgi:succinate dehydrogenase / fumarate reductase flavoprotein subunit